MPDLDVSFMTADPMLADTFRVTRRRDQVDGHGRTGMVVESVIDDVVGVVTQEDPADLMRNPDAQFERRRIFIATSFALRSASTGYQPDLVTWDGIDYTVVKQLPYSRFGAGTIEVIAESMHATDAPAADPQ